ncbi:MAG TPA: caspase family protein [Abditibacterium sp.]
MFALTLRHDVSPLAEPPTTKFLRIDAGMHTAPIISVATDAKNRILATGSLDKTVRLWSLETGELLSTLRPPINTGEEGKITAVALAPDASFIAYGGATGESFDSSFCVYLFDRVQNRMARRFTGLRGPTRRLAFSPDGQLLARVGGDGVRVFRISDGQTVWSDENFAAPLYGVAWDNTSRLVVSSESGALRLYNRAGEVLAQSQVEGRPQSVAFSPDTSKIAVGFKDGARVEVRDGLDLSQLFTPTNTENRGNFSCVAWSRDGKTLFAAGTFAGERGSAIRAWPESGRGAARSFAAAGDSIQDLCALDDGNLAWGASDPAWGVSSPSGEKKWFVGRPGADFRAGADGIRMAQGGDDLAFSYDATVDRAARFALSSRALRELEGKYSPPETLLTALRADLSAPEKSAPGLNVSDWEDQFTPQLNGAPLRLENGERARSVATARDGQSFLLGTEWNLRLYTRSGEEKWRVAAPSPTWAVHLAPQSGLALAAFGDGTIRWFRLRDGRELLAFFPHSDGKRWILWTPTGYYDCAPGSEELIGWQVNRKRDENADFFAASRFRDLFYRPDVIDLILPKFDEDEALLAANVARSVALAETGADAGERIARALREQEKTLRAEMKEEASKRDAEIRKAREEFERKQKVLQDQIAQKEREAGKTVDQKTVAERVRLAVATREKEIQDAKIAEDQQIQARFRAELAQQQAELEKKIRAEAAANLAAALEARGEGFNQSQVDALVQNALAKREKELRETQTKELERLNLEFDQKQKALEKKLREEAESEAKKRGKQVDTAQVDAQIKAALEQKERDFEKKAAEDAKKREADFLRAKEKLAADLEAKYQKEREAEEQRRASELPPIIELVGREKNSAFIDPDQTLTVNVRSYSTAPNAATTPKLLVYVDGDPVSLDTRNLVLKPAKSTGEAPRDIKLQLPQRDCVVTIIAREGARSSEPTVLKLKWEGKAPELVVRPKLYVLAVGVSRYKDEELNLRFAEADATAFVAEMQKQKGRLYEDVTTQVLVNQNATRAGIIKGLTTLRAQTTTKDVAMILLSGHGVNTNDGDFYFAPHETDTSDIESTGLPFYEIKKAAEKIVGKRVFFIDTCHAGNVMGGAATKSVNSDINPAANELLKAENGAIVFTASTGRQLSLEDPKWGHGAFTKALLEGLQGAATNSRIAEGFKTIDLKRANDTWGEQITAKSLDYFISQRVKELTQGRQSPTTNFSPSVQDFPLALKP